MNSWQIRIAGIGMVLLMAGCASSVSSNVKASAAHVAKYNELSAVDVATTLEKNVNEAKSANMPFLAPHYYHDAVQLLNDIKGSLGSKPKDVLVSNAAKGEAILEKGRAVMGIVQFRFSKELEFKAQLEEHNAPKLLAKEYEKVIVDFSALIEKVERERADNIAKEQDALLKSMQELLIRAIQENALHESDTINTDSKKKNADKQAPVTYAEALRIYQDAKAQIAASYSDQKRVDRLGAEALFAARHAQQVNERVALLQNQLRISSSGSGVTLGVATGAVSAVQLGAQADAKPVAMDKFTVEKIVLQEEDRLLAISTALGLKDLRNQSLDKQVEEIKRAASEVVQRSKNVATVTSAPQGLDEKLKSVDESTQKAMAQLAEKDRQLAEKDAQINSLKEKINQLESVAQPATVEPTKQ